MIQKSNLKILRISYFLPHWTGYIKKKGCGSLRLNSVLLLEIGKLYNKSNLDGEQNESGFTIDGVSYLPYLNSIAGDVIGYRSQQFVAEEGISFSKRFNHVNEISFIKVHVPIDLVHAIDNFNHTLTIICDELSGFSKINIPQNNDISFIAVLTETTETTYVYMSTSKIKFLTPYNIKSLTISIFNNSVFLSELDSAHVCECRINQHGYLEFLLNEIPASFKVNHRITLPQDVDLVSTSHDEYSYHNCVVIDGYINNAFVIFRNLQGKKMCRTMTNEKGSCNVSYRKYSHPLLAIASHGIDTSTDHANDLIFKTICSNTSPTNIYITPITTLVADYVVYLCKDKNHIQENITQDTFTLIENLLGIQNISSDYIASNNIDAGLRAYQIVCVAKICLKLFKIYCGKNVNHSIVMIKMAQALNSLIIPTSLFTDPIEMKLLYQNIAIASNIKTTRTNYEQICSQMTDLLLKYTTIKTHAENLSFELFANATKSLEKELEEGIDGCSLLHRLDMEYSNITINIILHDCFHQNILDSITIITAILDDLFIGGLCTIIDDAQKPIHIYECVLDNAHIIGESQWNNRIIKLNTDFDNQYEYKSEFTLNGKNVHPYTTWIIHELFHILGFGISEQWNKNVLENFYVGKIGHK